MPSPATYGVRDSSVGSGGDLALSTLGDAARRGPAPLLVPVLAFALGIVASGFVAGSSWMWAAGGLACLSCAVLGQHHRLTAVAGLAAGFICLGVQASLVSGPELPPHHVSRLPEEVMARPLALEGWVTVPPDPAPAEVRDVSEIRTRFVVEVTGLTIAGQRAATVGQARLSVLGAVPDLRYGDEVRGVFRLRLPRKFDNPGAFDYPRYLAGQGIFLEGWTREPIEVIPAERGSRILAAVFRLRAVILGRMDTAMPASEAALLKATVLGDRSGLTPEMNQAFMDSGTYHILAISGLNVSILAGTLFGLFRLFRISARLAALCSALLVTTYAGLAGGGASVMRAAIMADVYLAAVVLDRRGSLLNTWSLSALILVWWNPRYLSDVGFQLTFLATLGILLFLPRCERLLGSVPQPVRVLMESVAMTLAATAMTLPVLAVNFNRVSPIGVLANIPIVPLSGLITASGTAAAALFAVYAPGFAWLNAANGWLVDLLLALAAWFAAWPWSSIRVYTPTAAMVLCYYGALGALFFSLPLSDPPLIGRPDWKRRAIWSGVSLVFVVTGLIAWRMAAVSPPGVRLTFLDVGQGEAIFIQAPGSRTMLVDAGGRLGPGFDIGQQVITPFLLHEWVGRLDVLVLTHPESDHMGGAPALLKAFPIAEVWTGGGPAASAMDIWVSEFLRLRRIPHRVVTAGASTGWDGRVDVLHPPRDLRVPIGLKTKANNRSIVLRVRMDGQATLLTADIEAEAESFLTGSGAFLAATVIKVPHHGSRNSSTEGFVAAVGPKAAIVSVGYRNSYGHPHPSVLQRYANAGVRLFRTDRDGAITVEMGSDAIQIRSQRGEEVKFGGAG